jgi:uncharacterized damage-inducible protein DinB
MNDDFASLFAYNRWADRRILDACRGLSPEQYAAEPVPGWSSVRATLVHMGIVIEGWLCGLAGEPFSALPTEADLPAVDDVARLFDQADAIFERLGPRLTPEWLATPMTLSRGNRSATLPPWAVLRHLVNHATYHRGQVAAKLKRLGLEPPATDLVFWAIEQTPQAGA